MNFEIAFLSSLHLFNYWQCNILTPAILNKNGTILTGFIFIKPMIESSYAQLSFFVVTFEFKILKMNIFLDRTSINVDNFHGKQFYG